MLEITFYGVRGSTPCSCDATRLVGGNTSCVLVRLADSPPIILDMGTGLRYLGAELAKELGDQPFEGTALVSHLHWDHVQGLPFFVPLLRDGARLTLVGPPQDGDTLQGTIEAFVKPPLFPVDLQLLPGTVDFVEAENETFAAGSATITVAPIEHVGITNGYRVQNGTGSVAYLSDHQAPVDGSQDVPAAVVELCRGVDVLIHDAQYDEAEFEVKATWGHSTVEYAVSVAKAAGVQRLVLFHHDPAHDDVWIEDALETAQGLAGPDIEVLVAREGMTLRSGEDLLA